MKKSDRNDRLKADIEEFSDMVLRIAVSGTKNFHDAEDAVQETFMRLWNSYDKIENNSHKKAWLIKVTVNLCRDINRKSIFADFEPLERYLCFEEKGYKSLEIIDMIRRLPEHQRIAVYLHFYEGFSIAEISKITGRSPNTVGSDIHRAKKRLRIRFEERI